jgi:CubicO group peptidase (beta-lactamase class C family)
MSEHHDALLFEDAAHRAVEAGGAVGLVAAATTPDAPLIEIACGWSDAARTRPMAMDTVFAFASMTKTVTAVAALQLVEAGAIGLDDPVGRWVPHFAAPMVLDGFDPNGVPRLRPARSPVTLRRLLAHNSGLGHDIWSADLVRYKRHAGVPPLSSQKNAALEVPLMSDPGARWEYSIGLEWAGKVIEAVTGMTLGTYLRDHVTGPLGMRDTTFGIVPRHGDRLASAFERRADGGLSPVDFAILPGEYEAGGGGLYGTAQDYLAFLRMLLNEGRHGGITLLKPETVRMMQAEQLGGLPVTRMTTLAPHDSHDIEPFFGLDVGWNLAGMLMREAGPNGRPPGSWGWGGLANCYFWVDPINRVAGLILSQVLPFGDQTILGLFGALERDVYRRLAPAADRPA